LFYERAVENKAETIKSILGTGLTNQNAFLFLGKTRRSSFETMHI